MGIIFFGVAITLLIIYLVLFSRNISRLTDVQLKEYGNSRPGKSINIMALFVFLAALAVTFFYLNTLYLFISVIGYFIYLQVATRFHNRSLLQSGIEKEFVERQNRISILAAAALIFTMVGAYFVLFI